LGSQPPNGITMALNSNRLNLDDLLAFPCDLFQGNLLGARAQTGEQCLCLPDHSQRQGLVFPLSESFMSSTSSPKPSELSPATTGTAEPGENALGRRGHESPWYFAPCFGTWQGLVNPVLVSIPTVVLKSVGVSNAIIGYTTIATLPMGLKFLFGPMVDSHQTRRWWILRSGEWLILGVALVGLSLILPEFSIWLFLIALTLLAIVKSVQQIALQSFFTLSLTKAELALFSGLDAVFGRVATVLTASLLLSAADVIGQRFGTARVTWGLYFGGPGGAIFPALCLHATRVPISKCGPPCFT